MSTSPHNEENKTSETVSIDVVDDHKQNKPRKKKKSTNIAEEQKYPEAKKYKTLDVNEDFDDLPLPYKNTIFHKKKCMFNISRLHIVCKDNLYIIYT